MTCRRRPHQTDAYMSLTDRTRRAHNRAVEWCQDHQCNALTPEQTHRLGVSIHALDRLLTAGLWEVVELPPTHQLVHHIIDPRLEDHYVHRK